MNPAETAQYLAWFKKNDAALTAFAKGEQVQLKYIRGEAIKKIGHDLEWNDVKSIYVSLDHEYRVKPTPRTIFAVTNLVTRNVYGVYDTHVNAVAAQHRMGAPEQWEIVEFIEKQ